MGYKIAYNRPLNMLVINTDSETLIHALNWFEKKFLKSFDCFVKLLLHLEQTYIDEPIKTFLNSSKNVLASVKWAL